LVIKSWWKDIDCRQPRSGTCGRHNTKSREDIVAGLVYAITANYLTKVKGPRAMGKKVFLQGGVALNRAVGYAFAHSVDRTVVIPPNPELMGALGVALLALKRSRGKLDSATILLSLAAEEMASPGRFICKACRMHCSIDRFEVAGRRFPFGGRCSLYENVWKRSARVVAAPDLVEKASDHVSPGIYGEITPTVGRGLEAEAEGYDGIICIGPFNCLPFRISEAILKPLTIREGMPVLTYESDGYAVSPSVLRQVDVHIQQVLEHAGRTP
jgi:hypothetical protein